MDNAFQVPSTRRLFLTGAGASVLAMPHVARAEASKPWRLAHSLPRFHPVHAAIEFFVGIIKERTSGEVVIDIFADGELGQEVQIVEQARQGRLDIVKASASVIERSSPTFGVFNLPFVFRDQGHWRAVTSGAIGESILASSTGSGLTGLTFYEAGSRSFYAQKPIDHPDDLKGLRIRIQPSPTMMRLMQLLQAQPVQLAWDVTYEALSTGLVDGAENSVVALVVGRHGEVVRYYSFDEHTMVPDVLLVSNRRWDVLSVAQRQIFRDAAALSYARMNELWTPYAAEARRKVEAMGVTFTSPDKRPFIERAAPMTAEFGQDRVMAELVSQIGRV